MFHRIKSEPQAAVQKEENVVTEEKNESTTTYAAPSNDDADLVSSLQAEDDMSPVQQYAQQQASLAETEEVEEQETTEASNELQEEESETMNEEIETTETEQEEISAYRAPSSVTGGYQNTYGTAYAAPSAPAPEATEMEQEEMETGYEAAEDRRLVIVQGITMSGEIESCPHLVVEGTVEASLRGAEVLEVAESGVFYGAVEISEATISGRFEGDITVMGRLTVTETGQITGSITYGELAIEAGASIDGKLTPMKSAAAKKSPKAAARKTTTPKQNAGASNDAQLFPEETVVAAE